MKTRFKRVFDQFSGDNSECEPPDPISNSEVKPFSADDSVGFPCESRTSPDLYIKRTQCVYVLGFFMSVRYCDVLFELGNSCDISVGNVYELPKAAP